MDTRVVEGQAAKEFSLPCSCDLLGNSFATNIDEQNNRTDIQTEQNCEGCGGYLDSTQLERDSNTTQNAHQIHCLSD